MELDDRRGMRRLLLTIALVTLGCAHGGEVDVSTLASSSDQILWEAGEKAAQKKNWESARQIYKRIIDGFPQSEYGPGARLALGDSYFGEGGTASYILAIGSYRDFLTLYPSHPKSDYAQFRVAEAHFRQKNGPDRDQSETTKALDEYQRLLELYPQSAHVEEARTRIVECRQSLARAEFLAGFFYQRTRQACRAAVSRYESILSEYPDYNEIDEVLLRIGQALAACNRTAEALPHLARLLEEFKTSRHADEAKRLYDLLAAKAPAAPPPGTNELK
jgi:outer membrane protein assembly factor BamD